MNDIEILEDMRDNIYGAMQFEDDYQVTELEEKQFNALNLAIKSINRVKELEEIEEEHRKENGKLREWVKELKKPKYIVNFETNEITKLTNDFIPKSKIKEKIKEREHIIHNSKLKYGKDYYIYEDVITAREEIKLLQELLEE